MIRVVCGSLSKGKILACLLSRLSVPRLKHTLPLYRKTDEYLKLVSMDACVNSILDDIKKKREQFVERYRDYLVRVHYKIE